MSKKYQVYFLKAFIKMVVFTIVTKGIFLALHTGLTGLPNDIYIRF